LKSILLIFIFICIDVDACPRCWEKYQPEEIFDFSNGNHPKKEKTEVKVESEYEKILAKDCHSGIKAACDQLVRINQMKNKTKVETP
jgi:hypothetical protein